MIFSRFVGTVGAVSSNCGRVVGLDGFDFLQVIFLGYISSLVHLGRFRGATFLRRVGSIFVLSILIGNLGLGFTVAFRLLGLALRLAVAGCFGFFFLVLSVFLSLGCLCVFIRLALLVRRGG